MRRIFDKEGGLSLVSTIGEVFDFLSFGLCVLY